MEVLFVGGGASLLSVFLPYQPLSKPTETSVLREEAECRETSFATWKVLTENMNGKGRAITLPVEMQHWSGGGRERGWVPNLRPGTSAHLLLPGHHSAQEPTQCPILTV